MPEETNTNATAETEPTLESFNEPAAQTQQAQTPQEPPKPAEAQPAAATQTSEPAAQQTAQPAEDVYAKVTEGLTIPAGVEVDNALLDNVKALAKQHNLSADAVKAFLQLDLNNSLAAKMAEKKVLDDARAQWDKENKAKYGDNLKNVETDCSRVLAELDKEGKFKELLAIAGVEKHPATLGFLKAIGEVVLEKPSVSPNATISTDREVELEDFN